MKKVNCVVLGATGTVGTVALNVINQLPHLNLKGACGWHNSQRLQYIATKFQPEFLAAAPETANSLSNISHNIKVISGIDAMSELVSREDVDLVFCAISGSSALPLTLQALKCGKKVALSSKEVIVAAGELITKTAEKHGGTIIPVDSEHSAIFQCLQANASKDIKRLIITGSGGPLLNLAKDKFSSVTIEQAMAHPTWKMGPKITIDSATLMNKGLELIEAKWLFGINQSQLELIIQPEAVIHSMVEFIDGAVMALMCPPDMTLPVQYSLTHPQRCQSTVKSINFTSLQKLTFQEPDRDRFPCLRLAEAALTEGGTMQTVLNAANEIAVKNFLNQSLPFSGIANVIEETMNKHNKLANDSLEAVLEADNWARDFAIKYCKKINK